MSGVACKWCGDNPGTGRQECNRCRRIWLAGYEAARKQASWLAEEQCSCDEGCQHDDCCQPGRIVQSILAMQPVAADKEPKP